MYHSREKKSRYDGIGYSYLIEIKYIKTTEYREEKVQQLKSEAEKQLKTYGLDPKLQRSIGKTNLIKLVLIFSGPDLKHINEVPKKKKKTGQTRNFINLLIHSG